MFSFNKLPYELQEKILDIVFKYYKYDKLLLVTELNKYIIKYKNKNLYDLTYESFCEYWFKLYKEPKSCWNDYREIQEIFQSQFIDYNVNYNKCSYCNTLTHNSKLSLNQNRYNLYPSFRKLKKYELILPKNIIRNYCVLVNYKKLYMCNGCYFGYSKNKNINFYIEL
jgi:hypothetical protein